MGDASENIGCLERMSADNIILRYHLSGILASDKGLIIKQAVCMQCQMVKKRVIKVACRISNHCVCG